MADIRFHSCPTTPIALIVTDNHHRSTIQGQPKKTKHTKTLAAIDTTTSTPEDDEHILSILSSLFTNLSSESSERLRLIKKFVEEGYEKVERLLEMREGARGRVGVVEKEIEEEKQVSGFRSGFRGMG